MQEMQETQVRSLDGEDPLEKEMATHSSILAWRISQTEEPGGLQSMGSQSQTQLKRLSMHLWLGLHAFTAEGASSVPGQGTKIPQAIQYG